MIWTLTEAHDRRKDVVDPVAIRRAAASMRARQERMPGYRAPLDFAHERRGVSADFHDLLEELVVYQVRFMVVGAHALAAHGVPRAAAHLDILVEPSEENWARCSMCR
jgi:hypothetical protein